MIKKPWLTAPVTTAHENVVDVMVGNILNALPPMPNLSPDDKAACVKAGVPQQGMLKQIVRICKKHPDVMPRYHNLADFYTKAESVENLLAMRDVIVSVLEGIDNMLVGASDDALRMALDYYYSLKRAAKTSGEAGLRKHVNAIKQNFKTSAGQTIEQAMPEDDPANSEDPGTDDNADTNGAG